MFQYAFIKALSLRNNVDFKIDLSEFNIYFRPYELELFNIEKKYAQKNDIPRYQLLHSRNKHLNYIFSKSQNIARKINKKHFIEKDMAFNSNFLDIKSWYIEWYFQTEKYFKDFEAQIRGDFSFILPLSEKSEQIKEQIKNFNSVSIHIRRWDYLSGNNLQYHGVCWIDYYKKAITYLEERFTDLSFFFFSDDIEWVKENLPLEKAHYIDWNIWDSSWQDMQLMSLCKHNIIANSSFSWRGAWLNKNSWKIVIAPQKRFASNSLNSMDIIPESRTKL